MPRSAEQAGLQQSHRSGRAPVKVAVAYVQVLIEFYTALLGWSFEKTEPLDYWLIETGSSDEPGINGGLLPRPTASPGETAAAKAFVCTAQVASLDETLATGESLGVRIALSKMPVTGIGWLAYIKDPDGNLLGLLQPDEAAK